MDKLEAIKRRDYLSSKLEQWTYEYYVLDNPSVDDATFDRYMNELILLEKEFPDIKLATSPTNRVGGQVAKEFKKIPHKRLMLSLGNVYNEDEVSDFDRKIKDVTHEAINTYMGENFLSAISLHIDS